MFCSASQILQAGRRCFGDESRPPKLASLVLGTGRTIIAVVSDGAKQDRVSRELDAACVEALECGHFAQFSRPPEGVGPSRRPKCVPTDNLPESILWDVATVDIGDALNADDVNNNDGGDGTASEKVKKEGTPLVAEAKKHADMFEVKIKVNFKVPRLSWTAMMTRVSRVNVTSRDFQSR